MTAQLQFRDVTLGYDRHPAVHHLNGEVAWGATAEVLTSENLLEARRMCEAFDDSAAACAVDDLPSRAA
jgi:hypothetical protein